MNKPVIQLGLGIDPHPEVFSHEQFKHCVENHKKAIQFLKKHLKNKYLKINLAFFLPYGHKGISLLEKFVDRYKDEFTIILDGKFNEINNSLAAYLHFAFQTLGVHGITLNPFLGEKTLHLAFESCAKAVGSKGRVYILCATSESSNETLSFFQDNWKKTILACEQVRRDVFSSQENLQACVGVVVGANRENVLFSPELEESGLSVLAPGLGAQGADFGILKGLSPSNEWTFPMSRFLFAGGHCDLSHVKRHWELVKPYF